ncbi:MAG: hypothetical protein ABEJ99_05865 [Candidatus Nanohaloarchaea archaeon]
MDRKFFSFLGATAVLLTLITMTLIAQVRMIENAADFGQSKVANTLYSQGGTLTVMEKGDDFGKIDQGELKSLIWVGSNHCGADLPGFHRTDPLRLSVENGGVGYGCPIDYYVDTPLIVKSGDEKAAKLKVGSIR